MVHATAALCLTAAALLPLLGSAVDAATSVTVTSSSFGTSPTVMGINAGHAYGAPYLCCTCRALAK